jgi:hypothetical protein
MCGWLIKRNWRLIIIEEESQESRVKNQDEKLYYGVDAELKLNIKLLVVDALLILTPGS